MEMPPSVTVGIKYLTKSIAPKLIGDGHEHGGAGINSAVEPCVDVVYLQVQGYWCSAQ